jgi:uncharacterized protein (TIGR03435 family)
MYGSTPVVGKGGPKVREVRSDAPAEFRRYFTGRNEKLEAKRTTMDELARELRNFVDRPVIDKTGLPGRYDISLEATPFRFLSDPKPEDITIFPLIQELLGLRLEAEQVAMPVVIVDSVSRPTEN